MTTYVRRPDPNLFESFKRDEEARRGHEVTNREVFWSFVDHRVERRGRPSGVPRGILHKAADECLAQKGVIVPSLISTALEKKGYALDERHIRRSLALTSGMALERKYGVVFEDPKSVFAEGRLPFFFLGR